MKSILVAAAIAAAFFATAPDSQAGGVSFGFSVGGYAPRYCPPPVYHRPYCPPPVYHRPYCPPPVYRRPYCPPPVYYRPGCRY